jgi:hypothetical protein
MDTIKENIQQKLNSLSHEGAAYVLSAILFLFCIVINISLKKLNFESLSYIYWLCTLPCIYGFSTYAFKVFENLCASLIGKSIVSLFVIAASTFNLSMASKAVNQALEVPSSAFNYTRTLVSILTIPISGSLSFAVLFILIFILIMLHVILNMYSFLPKNIISFKIMKPNANEASGIFIGRAISLMVLLFLSIGFLNNNKWYSDQLMSFSRWFAYNFELEEYSYCSKPANARIAYLESDKIIIGIYNNSSYSFAVTTCKEKL